MTDQNQTIEYKQPVQPGTKAAQKSPKERLAAIFAQLKKPKFLTLIVLLFTLVVVVLALNLLSKKEPPVETIPEVQKISPTPEPPLDPTKENVGKLVNKYNDKLNNFDDFQRELIYPIVNLEISFK